MYTIWKFPLAINVGKHFFIVPSEHKILTVQVQKGIPTLWVWCIPQSPNKVDLEIYQYETGKEGPPPWFQYINTVQLAAGEYVLHYFKGF